MSPWLDPESYEPNWWERNRVRLIVLSVIALIAFFAIFVPSTPQPPQTIDIEGPEQ